MTHETNSHDPFDIFNATNSDKQDLLKNHFLNFKTGVTGIYIIGWVLIENDYYSRSVTLDQLSKENAEFFNLTPPANKEGFVLCEICNHRRIRSIQMQSNKPV